MTLALLSSVASSALPMVAARRPPPPPPPTPTPPPATPPPSTTRTAAASTPPPPSVSVCSSPSTSAGCAPSASASLRRQWAVECASLRRQIRRCQSTISDGPSDTPHHHPLHLHHHHSHSALGRSPTSATSSPTSSSSPSSPQSPVSAASGAASAASPSSAAAPAGVPVCGASLAALQERYGRRKAAIRESAVVTIQRAWRGWRGRQPQRQRLSPDDSQQTEQRKRQRANSSSATEPHPPAAALSTARGVSGVEGGGCGTATGMDVSRAGEEDADADADAAVSAEQPRSSSAAVRLDVILEALVVQREDDAAMRGVGVEEWGRRELDKERCLLKALLLRESEQRRQRREEQQSHSSPTSRTFPTSAEEAELRAVFAPLYTHYRHLQTLLAMKADEARSKVPLFHSADTPTPTGPLTPSDSLKAAGGSALAPSAFTRVQSTSSTCTASPSPAPLSSVAPASSPAIHFSPCASSPSLASLRVEKRALQVRLGEFTAAFQASAGRSISTAADIAPVRVEWARYKYLKHLLTDKGQQASMAVHNRLTRKRRSSEEEEPSTPLSARSCLSHSASVASTASLHSRSASHSVAFPSSPQSTSPTPGCCPFSPLSLSSSRSFPAASTPCSASSLAPSSPPSPAPSALPSPHSPFSQRTCTAPAAIHPPLHPTPLAHTAHGFGALAQQQQQVFTSSTQLPPLAAATSSSLCLSQPLASLHLSHTHPSICMSSAPSSLLPPAPLSHSFFYPGQLGFGFGSAYGHSTLPPMNLAWC